MPTQKLISEKYLAKSLEAEQSVENHSRNRDAITALMQFTFACCLIVLVVSWKSWLPFVANQVDLLMELVIAIYHG